MASPGPTSVNSRGRTSRLISPAGADREGFRHRLILIRTAPGRKNFGQMRRHRKVRPDRRQSPVGCREVCKDMRKDGAPDQTGDRLVGSAHGLLIRRTDPYTDRRRRNRMSGLAAAFKKAGVVAKNPRWSWSARSEDGKVVVMTLWKDLIDYKAKPISYSTFSRENLSVWIDRPGNRERLENLKWARDHCEGLFRVVITTAKDTNADTREIEDAHYQARMIMKLVELNEQTGEFRAVNFETSSNILRGSQGEEGSVSALGNVRHARRKALQENLIGRDARESAAAGRRVAAGEVLRARPVAGEINFAELSCEHIARYPKIRARLAE